MNYYVLPNGRTVHCSNPVEAKYIYSEVFDEQVYTSNGITLKQDSVVFDVGANIGLFSLYVLENYKNSQVYAFEPASHIYSFLKENTKDFSKRCKTYQAGLSNQETHATFYYYPNFPTFSTFHLDSKGDKNRMANVVVDNDLSKIDTAAAELDTSNQLQPVEEKCKLLTLSSIIADEDIKQIDLLKMDVQRAELYVLEGINEKDWQKVKQIAFELHHIGEEQTKKIENLLSSQGFILQKYKDKFFEEDVPVYMMYATRQ